MELKKITELEYLNALDLIRSYKAQLKNEPKEKRLLKSELLFKKTDLEIAMCLAFYFKDNNFLRYSKILKVIEFLYQDDLKITIKKSVVIQVYKKLKEKNILVVKGDFMFREYHINSELLIF